MRQTLHHGDKLFVSTLGYAPTKGDVVILRTDAFGDEALVTQLMPSWSSSKAWARVILFSLAFLFFVIEEAHIFTF